MVWITILTRVVILEPSRSTTRPDAATETKEPRDMHRSMSPISPGVSPRSSRMAGMRETQVAKTNPEPA